MKIYAVDTFQNVVEVTGPRGYNRRIKVTDPKAREFIRGLKPGDEVQVHDAPTSVPYGERLIVQRTATVTRAGRLERLWTKLAGHLELTELYEVSFSERRRL